MPHPGECGRYHYDRIFTQTFYHTCWRLGTKRRTPWLQISTSRRWPARCWMRATQLGSLSDSGGIFDLSSQALALAAAAGVNTEGLRPIPVPMAANKHVNATDHDSGGKPTACPLFDQIYMVGDSWSDSGVHFGLSSQLLAIAAAAGVDTTGLQPIPFPPYAHQYSNGPVFPRDNRGSARRAAHQFFGRRRPGARHVSVRCHRRLHLSTRGDSGRRRVPGGPGAAQSRSQPFGPGRRPRRGDLGTAALGAFGAREPDRVQRHSRSRSHVRPRPSGLFDRRRVATGGADRSGQSRRSPTPPSTSGIGTVIFETLPAASFLPVRRPASARTPGDRRCRGRRRQSGAQGRRARAAPAGP